MFVFAFAVLMAIAKCAVEGQSVAVNFFGIGDWGDPRINGVQRSVAETMELVASQRAQDFVVTTGDNFYPDGVASATDSRFNSSWRNIYDGTALAPLDWYIALGNHDYGSGNGEQYYQVEFTEIDFEQRWKLPNLWHSFTKQQQDASVKFVMMDTESFRRDEEARQVQLAFIETEFASNDADFIILVGHHPIYSAGLTGPIGSSELLQHIVPLLNKYQVDIYLCGHDHNLQYIYFNDTTTHHVLSGGGGSALHFKVEENEQILRDEYGLNNEFFFTWGFATFEVTGLSGDGGEMLTTRFYSRENATTPIYQHERKKINRN